MNKDIYSSFKELKEKEDEGSFHIICETESRSKQYAIMAPHGGNIEPGTTEIVLAIAREDLSFYIFNANKSKNNKDLHITTTRFDEPQSEKMLEEVETVLAIHGASDPKTEPKERIWVGGQLREKFEINLNEKLSQLGFLVEIDSRFSGKEPNNICNRGTSQKGMQLELTRSLRDKLKKDKELLKQFSDAVRTAMMLTYPTS